MTRVRLDVRCALAAAVACVATACGSSEPLSPATRLSVVASPVTTDTIQATEPQALVVQVIEPDGAPLANSVVRVAASLVTDSVQGVQPTMLAAPLGAIRFQSTLTLNTDASGRAAMLVQYGTVAGPGALVVAAAAVNGIDTVHFTIQPGATSTVRTNLGLINPGINFSLLSGTTLSITGTAIDRLGNAIPDAPVTFVGTTPNLSVTPSGTVVAMSPGHAGIAVRSPNMQERIITIDVMPHDRVIVYTASGRIITMNLDGSNATTVATIGESSVFPQAARGGSLIAYYTGNPATNGAVWVIGADLVPRVVASQGAAWPRWSADAQWLYYSAVSGATKRAIMRVHPDGTGRELIGVYAPTAGPAPGVSPDGQTVVVEEVVDQLGPSLLFFTVGGGTSRTLVPSGCSMPQFSFDGRRITCIATQNQQMQTLNVDGTNVQALIRDATLTSGVDWMPGDAYVIGVDRFGIVTLAPSRGGAQITVDHFERAIQASTIR